MADVSAFRDIIPEQFLDSHDYESPDDPNPVMKYELTNADGSVPLDLAFCRWLAT